MKRHPKMHLLALKKELLALKIWLEMFFEKTVDFIIRPEADSHLLYTGCTDFLAKTLQALFKVPAVDPRIWPILLETI